MFILLQSKKQYYDGELERLEKQYQQQSSQMETEHTSRLREDARRLKAQQEKELSRKSSALKADPKEVQTDSQLGWNAWKVTDVWFLFLCCRSSGSCKSNSKSSMKHCRRVFRSIRGRWHQWSGRLQSNLNSSSEVCRPLPTCLLGAKCLSYLLVIFFHFSIYVRLKLYINFGLQDDLMHTFSQFQVMK